MAKHNKPLVIYLQGTSSSASRWCLRYSADLERSSYRTKYFSAWFGPSLGWMGLPSYFGPEKKKGIYCNREWNNLWDELCSWGSSHEVWKICGYLKAICGRQSQCAVMKGFSILSKQNVLWDTAEECSGWSLFHNGKWGEYSVVKPHFLENISSQICGTSLVIKQHAVSNWQAVFRLDLGRLWQDTLQSLDLNC